MTALLAVDVGNTNTVIGVFRDGNLEAHWRIQTVAERTSDELAVLLKTLLDMNGIPWRSLNAGIISSVVPPAVFGLQRFFKSYCGDSFFSIHFTGHSLHSLGQNHLGFFFGIFNCFVLQLGD